MVGPQSINYSGASLSD